MPLRPEGATLSLGGYTLFIDDIKQAYITQLFTRDEFKHKRLREVLETTGVSAIFVTKFAGGLAQLSYTCANPTVRPVTPDDSDIDNIYKRWDIVQYKVVGAPSVASQISGAYAISITHQNLLAEMQAEMEFAKGDFSITKLLALQSSSVFSNLTTTGITLTSNSIGSISNVLITSFEIDYAYEIPTNTAGSTNLLYQSFRATIEARTLVNAES